MLIKYRTKGKQRAEAQKFTNQKYKDKLEPPKENYHVNRRLCSAYTASTESRYRSHPCPYLILSYIENFHLI